MSRLSRAPVAEPEPPALSVAVAEPVFAEPAIVSKRSPRRSRAAAPPPEPMAAANDPAPEPAIRPIIIGAEQDVVVEKKRGWWRR